MNKTSQRDNTSNHMVPWLVRASDLRRYPGRALDYCLRGGVVFFYYTWKTGPKKGRSQLFALLSIELRSEMYWEIFAAFRAGRLRVVNLSELPPLRSRKQSEAIRRKSPKS